jgi:3-hydroxyacyl-[acyl-carrier-protein] dehydratase
MRFLLVDSIVDLELGIRAVGIKNVTMSEDFFADHFPDRPIMPGMLIIESMVQLADWVVRQASDFATLGLASGFESIKFRRIVRPSDQLRLEVRRLSGTDATATFQGKAYRLDELVASASLTLALHPLKAYLDPEEARRAFEILYLHGTEKESA